MTTPTPDLIAEFAEAFDKVKARWPDAPTDFPDGLVFGTRTAGRVYVWDSVCEREIPAASALALCCATAMEIGVWADGKYFSVGGGSCDSWQWSMGEDGGQQLTLPAACLAALRAMGEP
jgi:hypothetical protein